LRLSDVQFSRHGHVVVAHLAGEIDLSNADDIGGAIVLEVPHESAALVLDLSAVDYVDSAGIRLIYQLRQKLRARGQALRIVIPADSPTNDALRLAGVADSIHTLETVDDALRGVGDAGRGSVSRPASPGRDGA
jgi:anti-sigma B factor antagonist